MEKKDEALMWGTVKRVVERVVGREEEVEYRRAKMGERVKVMRHGGGGVVWEGECGGGGDAGDCGEDGEAGTGDG